MGRQYLRATRMTSPSLPWSPAVAQAIRTFAGAIMLPSDAPVVCRAAVIAGLPRSKIATSRWRAPKSTFALVFDPVTKQTKEWMSPSGPQSQPYGIAAVGNVLYYNESGPRPNTMVRFDTRTEQFQSVIVPSGGIVLRHIMPDANGNIALACSGINKVGLLEISNSPRTQ